MLALVLVGCSDGGGGDRSDDGRSDPTTTEAGPADPGAPPDRGTAPGEATTPSDAGEPIAIEGTELAVPPPDATLGTDLRRLAIPLIDQPGEVARGVAFYRPGPIEGSVVGGVSIVFDDSPAVRGPDGRSAAAVDLAELANPGLEPEVSEIAGRTVLGWPDSEVVPSDGIPQEDRSVSRYVIVLDEGIAMVTFDAVPDDLAAEYLATVAGAL